MTPKFFSAKIQDMPKCMNTDLILNRDRKQSSTLIILDHPQNQIKIEGSEPNGSDKKSFSTSTYLQNKMQKARSLKYYSFTSL